MENFSITEAIEQAVQTERLGYNFYNQMAEKFKDDEAILRLFQMLSAKELEHEKTFSELKEKVRDAEIEGWAEFSQYLRAIVESAFFLGKDRALASMADVKTVGDAFDYAIGFEKESLLYYIEIGNALKDNEIIDEIINEERSHIIQLGKSREDLISQT